ncbi:Pentatricopeptide repeat-containing protein At4g25270, chloroplastic [Linum grandiflorum]
MALIQPAPSPSPMTTKTFSPPVMFLRCAASTRKTRKQKLTRKLEKRHGNTGTSLSFPKSSPTPILIKRERIPRSELEALDKVVDDIETSIQKGIHMDAETFASLLETCYRLGSIEHGIRIHRLLPTPLLRKNFGIGAKLMRLYASSGYLDEAHQVFDEMSRKTRSAFVWNSLIAGYAEMGQYEDAMALYFQMEEDGVKPDRFTFPRVLKACAGIGDIRVAEAVHRDVVRFGYGYDSFVMNALVDMYAKCGDIVKARRIFDKIGNKDSISWNSMLTGYIRHGLVEQALRIFVKMVNQGVEPDSVTVSIILANAPSFEVKFQLHGFVIKRGMQWEVSIVNSLMACYAIKGELNRARQLFDEMPERDVVSWNSIITAHKNRPESLSYFEKMEVENVIPDKVTFVVILSTCAHLGWVEEGERLFDVMRGKYGMRPIMEHYACMVNLYGRAGLVKKAYDFVIESMELEAGATVWGALLHACYVHGNVEIGEVAAKCLFELEPDNEHNFELLVKIYNYGGRMEDAERVRRMMIDRGL